MKRTDEYHICDDGTVLSKKDHEWLKKHKKKAKKKKGTRSSIGSKRSAQDVVSILKTRHFY